MKKGVSKILMMFVPLVIGVALGAIFLGGSSAEEAHEHELASDGTWTCSMHPQVRQPEAGACPFCGMDLIPATSDNEEDLAVLKMSNAAIELANIQTTVVGSERMEGALALNGKIKADERRVNTQTTHFAGRIEALYKNYVGEVVRKGEKVASLYSPELLAAQEELIEAKKLEKSNPVLLEAARKKLNYWKLTAAQIDEIEASEAPMRNFDLLAGFDGVVTQKLVNTGDHLHEGQGLLEITDLSKLWVVFELYERDLPKVQVGDEISFTARGVRGSQKARVTFISPEVNARSRVVEVRADVSNPGGYLKPDMFVEGALIMDASEALLVPKSAVLWTGRRSIVYVKLPGEQSFELRNVVLGESLGDAYVIEEGLRAGETVVTNGAFTLDAEAQLRGKISMMNPAGRVNKTDGPESPFSEVVLPEFNDYRADVQPAFRQQLTSLSAAYIKLKDMMVEGNGGNIRKEGVAVKKALDAVDMSLTSGAGHTHWMSVRSPMQESLELITTSGDRDLQRLQFINLSKALINAVQSFGTSMESPLYVQFCPMANNDKGATWISTSEEIINPYFGDVMLNCGNVEDILINE
ncbi:MAG: hypothetical protein Roseis2KO_51360 [Roseivirga sp.]